MKRMMSTTLKIGRLVVVATGGVLKGKGGTPGFGLVDNYSRRSFGVHGIIGTRKMASYGGGGGGRGAVTFPEPHMSELPVPEGPWDKHQKKMNSKNNRHLFIGLAFFFFTQTVLWNSGLITLNSTIPELPGAGKFGGGCVPTPPVPPAPKC